MTTNREYFELAKKYIPGGVHSPVRSFKGVDHSPLFINRAKGAFIFDEEGNSLIDFCMSFGPLILGHAHPVVEEAVIQAVHRGLSFGACEKYSLELAEYIVNHIPFIDQVRFVNSGTEAVMTALRLARGVTGKSKVIKFNGCYHGHVDSMLIKSGSGLAGTAEASSSGISANQAKDTLVVELGDLETLKRCFNEHQDIAAIIVEPLPANYGLLIQEQSFLKELRSICDKEHALLIFDEVISGFRVDFGGMAAISEVTPDIVTYGKIVGGGMPVGCVGAKKAMMEQLAPLGNVYQAGTLSANPVAMCAGLATLKEINSHQFYEQLNESSLAYVQILNKWCQQNAQVFDFPEMSFSRFGSLFWMYPANQAPTKVSEIPKDMMGPFNKIVKELIPRGVYLAPNPYEVGFVSIAHDDEVLEKLTERLWN